MKARKILVSIVLCLGFLLVPQVVDAKDITVTAGEKIQDVIDNETTEAGDVLILDDGLYQEDLTINKDLTIKGSDAQNVTIEGGVTISANVTLENVTVEASQEQLVLISGKEALTVNMNNAVIRYKDWVENKDYGKAYWTYGIKLDKTANGTTLNVTNTEVQAQYAIWINGEENKVTIDESQITGWAALDISNGSSSKTQAMNNVVTVTNSTLTGVSYQAVHDTNGYGTVVIGGQDGLQLTIQNSTITNAITTENPLDLIQFGDAYIASKNVQVGIDQSKLINTDDTGNSYVYNYGSEEMANPTSNNMVVVTETTNITAPEGTVDKKIEGYITLTISTSDGDAIMKLPEGLTLPQPEDPVLDGYTFDGWYQDETYQTPFDFTQPINQDTTLYAKYTKIEEETPVTPEVPEEDIENPSTSDIDLALYVSIGILSLAGIVFVSKKKMAR